MFRMRRVPLRLATTFPLGGKEEKERGSAAGVLQRCPTWLFGSPPLPFRASAIVRRYLARRIIAPLRAS